MAKDEKYAGVGRYKPQDSRRSRQPGQSLSEEIMELDAELLRLLTRRSVLLGKLRKGRAHASTPGIIKSEKQIRGAWERAAGSLSGGTRLSRQLFSLLGELEIKPERDGEGHSPFNLSPSRQPVDVDVPGQTSAVLTQIWLSIAASAGLGLRLPGAPRSAPLLEIMRAFAQTGVHMEWQGETLVLDGKGRPDYHGKAIFLGDDALTFYIFVFLGVAYPGKIRFIGGASLKEADLVSALGHFMPGLGARLIPVLPGAKGLPVNLECSGKLPDELVLPECLPDLAVLAVLAAAQTWGRKIAISLVEQSPVRQRHLLNLARNFFQVAPDLVRIRENRVEYNGSVISGLNFPSEIHAPIDPDMASGLLALPVFTGGRVKLSGKWIDTYQSEELINLFAKFSLNITHDDQAVFSSGAAGGVWPEALELEDLSNNLHPLFWVLNVRLAVRAKAPILIRRWPAGADLELAGEFMTQVGYTLERTPEGLVLTPLAPDEFKAAASKTYGWPCPSFDWGVALSLAAFMRSNLKIGNPECVSRLQPDYWFLYNRLPSPNILKTVANVDNEPGAPGRRRIRTSSIAELEPREDFEDRG